MGSEGVDSTELHLPESPGECEGSRWRDRSGIKKVEALDEDEEAAALFLLMTISRGFAERSEPQTESSPANSIALS